MPNFGRFLTTAGLGALLATGGCAGDVGIEPGNDAGGTVGGMAGSTAGTTGAGGTTGLAGVTGNGGVAGGIGGAGTAGVTGLAGTTGAAGTTGSAGSTGLAGRGGTTGTAGTTGAAGRGGSTGTAGTSGPAGTTGTAGRGGTTGVAGTTGAAGRGGAGGSAGTAGGVGGGGSGQGGAPVAGSGGGGSTGPYACNGSTTGYNALMIKSGSTWTVTNGGQQAYSGSDMEAALRAAYGSLTSGRTSKQSILVQGSGDISASSQILIPSYTVLNVCGTINVTGTPSGSDRSPVHSRSARDIEIPNLKMTGSPQYGLFFRGTNNISLGQIDLRLTRTAGIGIRVDTSGNAGSDSTFNQGLRIDYVYGSGMGSHIVETYGINNITIGRVDGDNVGECGVLFNRSTNATVDVVSCTNCATGTGYASFRMANNNGRINNGYATVNIVVGSVVARGGGRGIFSVSGSGGARIDHVDIQDTGNNSILLENANNVTVGSTSRQSRIASSGQLRIAGTSSDIRIQNIAVSGTTISESPCATNSTWTSVNGAPSNCN